MIDPCLLPYGLKTPESSYYHFRCDGYELRTLAIGEQDVTQEISRIEVWTSHPRRKHYWIYVNLKGSELVQCLTSDKYGIPVWMELDGPFRDKQAREDAEFVKKSSKLIIERYNARPKR